MASRITPTDRGTIGFSFEDNDCAIRAVVNATGMNYELAHSTLRAHGRSDKKGSSASTIAKAYSELGLKLEGVFGSTKTANSNVQIMVSIFGKENVKHYMGMTLDRFINGRLKGKYICVTNKHAFAVVDGKLIDNRSLPAGLRITFIFKA